MSRHLAATSSDAIGKSCPAELDPERIPAHVAVIMDGNGRWAQARGSVSYTHLTLPTKA